MPYQYAIVTPVKNEMNYFPKTAESILRQEIRPRKWVIINDGSTDGTEEFVQRLAAENEWIIAIHNQAGRQRKPGGESVLPLGLNRLQLNEYDFIVRMDGDLSFEASYFRELFEAFEKNPELGIASGVCFVPAGEAFIEEKHPRFHTRGPLKTYRVACFREIGGLTSDLGWDTIDEIKANMLGWKTLSLPELKIIHWRKTQTASGALHGLRNLGRAGYFTGYHPLFMLLRALRRMLEKPYVIGGMSMLRGYYEGYLRNLPTLADPKLIKYLRQQQINRLFGRPTIWK